MTSASHRDPAPSEAAPSFGGLEPCLDALDRAVAAASDLGLDTSRARSVVDESRVRLGIAPDAYVLALAGGTGVGKSTILNALAESVVSDAGPRRPTTDRPVAWVARTALPSLRPLLERLDVGEVRTHEAEWANDLVVLDLPDLDSIDTLHRQVVDEILPRVDAVAWVVDPEKYADAVLHLGYLAPLGERFARQAVVVNKADLLGPTDVEAVRADTRRRLAADGLTDVRVLLASAIAIDSGRGLAELRAWLTEGAEAKRIIADRIAADVVAAGGDLGRRAGIGGGQDGRHGRGQGALVGAADRSNVADSIERDVLRLLDLPGLRRQAVAATREVARARGTGPAGFLTSRLYRGTGLASVSADPAGHLRGWRRRGSLAGAVGSVATLSGPMLAALPPEARPAVAAAVAPALAAQQADGAIDAAIASLGEIRPPSSRLWPILGLAQALVAADLLIAALWLVALWVSHVGAGAANLPVVGPVPWPFALLLAGLVVGFVLSRLLALHAGWLGRRWAEALAREVSAAVGERASAAVLEPLDALESSRRSLAAALRTIESFRPAGGEPRRAAPAALARRLVGRS